MRLRLTILTVVTVLTLLRSPSASAQWAQMGPQPGPTQYGYYVPVLTMEDEATAETPEAPVTSVSPASFSSNVSDQGPSCSAGCDSGCSSRSCRSGCQCLSCQRSSIFSRGFVTLEHMSWYNKGINLPPLVTTSPAGTAFGAAGVLGAPGTSVLFGGRDFDSDRQNAARFTFGLWKDECRELGVGARLYGVEGGALRYTASSTGTPILARPFVNTDPAVLPPGPQQDALVVAFQPFPAITGNVAMAAATDVMGTEIFLRSMVDQGDNYRVDILGGWQFNRVDSDLAMSSRHILGATTFQFNDLFDVENTYNAGTFGVLVERYREEWTLSFMGKIGVGNMNEQVTISGNNTVIAGGSVTTNGGLYAQPTNIGTFSQDLLVWSPEVNLKASYAISQKLSLSVGYTFLWWSKMAFAGDQLDTNINTTQLNGGGVVGPADPSFTFNDTDFWVQSIDIGLNWNY